MPQSGPPAKSDPFHTYFEVPVAGGALSVARAGPPPEDARAVVLAIHGLSSSHMAYRTVARELCESTPACLLAPDLRGRGRSAQLPEPYGMATHVADVIAVLDHARVDRAIVVGHSMGSSVAARLAADHPDRAAAVVLVDSGLPLVPDVVGEADEGSEVGGLFERFARTFASVEEYVAFWRNHPALADAWDEDTEAFAHCDYVVDEHGVRCAVNPAAVALDIHDLAFDGKTWDAVTRVQAPVRLFRAERGLLDADPLIPLQELDEFLRENRHVIAERVPDVNHFTILMGGGCGPRRVAAFLAGLAT